jgi:hypothetical protein
LRRFKDNIRIVVSLAAVSYAVKRGEGIAKESGYMLET